MYAPAIELDPGVYPRIVHVGLIGVGLLGEDHEALPGMQAVAGGVALLVIGKQGPLARDDVVEEVVVALCGPKGVSGPAELPPILVRDEVDVVGGGEDLVGVLGYGHLFRALLIDSLSRYSRIYL